MNERTHANIKVPGVRNDASTVAESLHKDFVSLIAIFDRQLANGKGSTLPEARAAAERGLELSRELIELLRSPQ